MSVLWCRSLHFTTSQSPHTLRLSAALYCSEETLQELNICTNWLCVSKRLLEKYELSARSRIRAKNMIKPIDKNGNEVHVGDKVKIISLESSFLCGLEIEAKKKVQSMIGGMFLIDEIDEYGGAWVHKEWWNDEGDECESHGVSLSSNEMELVSDT